MSEFNPRNLPACIIDNTRTRFGQPGGADPREAAQKMHEEYGPRVGVRNALRRLTSVEFDDNGRIPSSDELAAVFGGKRLTIGEGVALRLLSDALRGDAKAAVKIMEHVDGPVPKVAVKVQASIAELIAATRQKVRDEQSSSRPA